MSDAQQRLEAREEPESVPRPSARARAWQALGRPAAPHLRGRFFWQALAFAVLLGITIVWDAFSDESLTAPMLGPLMMVLFGIGELSGRPLHVALSRLLGAAVFATWLILIPVLWV